MTVQMKSVIFAVLVAATLILCQASTRRHIERTRITRGRDNRVVARMGLRFEALPTRSRSLMNGSVEEPCGKGKGKGGKGNSRRRTTGQQTSCDDGDSVEVGSPDGNEEPSAADDSVSTQEGVSVDINVLGNDADPEMDTLSVSSFTAPSSGTVNENGDGTLKYTPNLGFVGQDMFTYTVSDGNGGSDTATVFVDVTASGGPDPFSTALPGNEGSTANGEGPVPSNEGEPINQPEDVAPSNEGDGQQADTLGIGDGPEIDIIVETPGFTLQLDETFDDLGGNPSPPPPPPTPMPHGPVPSNDD